MTSPATHTNATSDNRTRFAQRNRTLLREFQRDATKAIGRDSTVDLGPLLMRHRHRYACYREERRNEDCSPLVDLTDSPRKKPTDAPQQTPADATSMVVTHALDPKVMAVIKDIKHEEHHTVGISYEQFMLSRIEAAVVRGEELYALGSRTVTQIHPDIVVKSFWDHDVDEVAVMEHIHQVSKDFPSPKALGSVTFNGKTFIFMTFIKGSSLEQLWPSLSENQKASVCDQLNTILQHLRSLPLPSTQLGGGVPSRCKYVSRVQCTSTTPINDENEFNDFLLSKMNPKIVHSWREYLRTKCLRSDHRIVMTHGDLHPRNILAEVRDGQITITGLVDWELAGAYPEYWEYVRSLNAMLTPGEDDWWRYLPIRGIGEYVHEQMTQVLLEGKLMQY